MRYRPVRSVCEYFSCWGAPAVVHSTSTPTGSRMPGLSSLIGHQSLNSSKNEKSQRRWKWPKWLKKKKPAAVTTAPSTSPQKSIDEYADLTSQSLGSSYWFWSTQHLHSSFTCFLVPPTPAVPPQQIQNHDSMEAIVQEDLVCLLCLQIPNEWFTVKTCGCKFCHQVKGLQDELTNCTMLFSVAPHSSAWRCMLTVASPVEMCQSAALMGNVPGVGKVPPPICRRKKWAPLFITKNFPNY